MSTPTRATLFASLLCLGCVPASNIGESLTLTTTTTTTTSESGETTTTGAFETSETEDPTDPTGCGALGCHDDGFPGSCDLFAQDCPPGDKCVPVYQNGSYYDNQCHPINGDAGPGEACTGDGLDPATDDCDGSSWCLSGICHPFCSGDRNAAMCIDGWACTQPASDPPICLESCNPLTEPCAGGQACVWAGTNFGCAPAGAGLGPGEACMFANDCQDGICVGSEALPSCADNGCCALFCSLAAGDGACAAIDPGYTCQAFFLDPAPVGFEDLGVCLPMG